LQANTALSKTSSEDSASVPVANEEPSPRDVKNPFYNKENSTIIAVDSSIVKQSQQTTDSAKGAAITTNPGCSKTLSDNDFSKIKRKLFTESATDKMISIAKKYCNGKCITTGQLKGLSIFSER